MRSSSVRDLALSAILFFASAAQADPKPGFTLVERGLPLEKRMLEGRACRTGFVPCGNGYCRPTDGQCCANGTYADADEICCSGGSAPIGSTCCPGHDTHARPGYYCCTDGYSCRIGRTCRDCTPVDGANEGGSSDIVTTPTVTLPPSATSGSGSDTSSWYTFTITYTYYSWILTYDRILSASAPTTTDVVTSTVWSVEAVNAASASSSASRFSRTASFPTPSDATVIPSVELSLATNLPLPTSGGSGSGSDSGSGSNAPGLNGVLPQGTGTGASYREGAVAVVGVLAGLWAVQALIAMM